MSELGSAVGETVAQDVRSLTDDQLREELIALTQHAASLTAAHLKRVREFERRQLHQADGHRSAGAWLRAHTLVSGREGSSAAWLARRLSRLPLTLAALEAGEITQAHAKQIARLAHDVTFDVMAEGEPMVVDAARQMDPGEFHRLIDHLRAQWIPEQVADEADDAFRRRRFDIGEAFAGLVPVDGWLDPLTAEKLRVALNALTSPDTADTPTEARRTPTQRRHDALDEALSRLLDQGELPTVRRERPHVSMIVDLEALMNGRGVGVFEWSETVDIGTARMLVCDADIHPLITQGRGWNPVSIVEPYQSASKTLWRYLRTRDQHCRFPGCDMPAVWTDAHHIVWRSEGGPTSNDNCCLLCKYHHRLVHNEHRPWVIHGNPEGTLTFTSPSGQAHLSPVPGIGPAPPPRP